MPRRKMSVTQLTLLTSLSMMGAGIIMLPAKFAEIGAISMLSWIVTALASGAVAYVFAQCGMLSKRMGGLGGFAEYAFGEPGAFLVVRPAAHMCLCGESPLSARTGEGLATRQVGEGNDFDGGSR